MIEYALFSVFPAVMVFAAAMDLFTMRISNRISILLGAAFLVAAIAAGLSFDQLLMHVSAGALMLVAGFALFAVGGFGGGDAKILAAAGLWLGLEQVPELLISVAVFGGVLAVLVLHYRSIPMPVIHTEWGEKLHQRGSGIPYGIAIAAGALVVYPKTHWISVIIPAVS